MAKVITDRSQVPADYKRIKDMTPNRSEQARLSRAHERGEVRAVKLVRNTSEKQNGAVWVEERSAEACLRGQRNTKKQGGDIASCDPSPPPRGRVSSANSRGGVLDALNRIAAALEAIATNPGNK